MNTLLNFFRIGFWLIFIISVTLHLRGFFGIIAASLASVFFIGWTILEIYLYVQKRK